MAAADVPAQAAPAAPAPPAAPDSLHELKNTNYEAFILALSILSVVNIGLIYLAPVPQVDAVVRIIDVLLSLIFLGDFFYRLFTAPTKRRYFVRQLGWLDLLSSLPFPQAKIFRLFRVVRVVRLLREVGFRHFVGAVLRDRAGSALLVVLFLAILLLEFGAAAVLAIELRAPDSNITDASDAIWYTYVTVTTVGYGDRYPVTNAGRLVGIIIMTVGVGLFGTLTGFLTQAFVPEKTDEDGADLKAELTEIRRRLEALDARLGPAGGPAPGGPPA